MTRFCYVDQSKTRKTPAPLPRSAKRSHEDPMIQSLIARGAMFILNHSGGKDSQAQTAYLRRVIPAKQLVIIHAELPEVDWPGIREHIEATAKGIPVHYTRAAKTFFQMVEHRGMWPSPQYRQCTSDLKRDPIEVVIRRLSKETGNKLIVSCEGIRAQESTPRRLRKTFEFYAEESKAGREWYKWLPIHDWTLEDVWDEIEAAGEKPHPAYAAGMTRLSCCFCIMSSKGDLATAAKLQPELFRRYAATERRIDQTMFMPKKVRGQPAGQRVFLDEMGLGAEPEMKLAA
jgi:3'-phosphoadenosine 5'-phosphosulfate sulfotransferase (PAPS reductase)/FAD synthetase